MYQIDAIAFVLNWTNMELKLIYVCDEVFFLIWYQTNGNFKEPMVDIYFVATVEWFLKNSLGIS